MGKVIGIAILVKDGQPVDRRFEVKNPSDDLKAMADEMQLNDGEELSVVQFMDFNGTNEEDPNAYTNRRSLFVGELMSIDDLIEQQEKEMQKLDTELQGHPQADAIKVMFTQALARFKQMKADGISNLATADIFPQGAASPVGKNDMVIDKQGNKLWPKTTVKVNRARPRAGYGPRPL